LQAQLILLSGINFQGRWKNVFNTSFTKQEAFKDFEDKNVIGNVNMMFQRGPFPFAAIRDLGSYFIELPYGTDGNLVSSPDQVNDDRISMILALPRKGLPLFEAIENIYKFGFKKVLLELKRAKEEYEDDEVEVHIPRFEIETSINLVPNLQEVIYGCIFNMLFGKLIHFHFLSLNCRWESMICLINQMRTLKESTTTILSRQFFTRLKFASTRKELKHLP
jgi:serine protease inhibitor